MAPDNGKTKSVAYAKIVVDLLTGPATDVTGRIRKPRVIRVAGDVQRARKAHGQQFMMILREVRHVVAAKLEHGLHKPATVRVFQRFNIPRRLRVRVSPRGRAA